MLLTDTLYLYVITLRNGKHFKKYSNRINMDSSKQSRISTPESTPRMGKHSVSILSCPCKAVVMGNSKYRELARTGYLVSWPPWCSTCLIWKRRLDNGVNSVEMFMFVPCINDDRNNVLPDIYTNIQGEHKVFPWLLEFITRKILCVEYKLSVFHVVFL